MGFKMSSAHSYGKLIGSLYLANCPHCGVTDPTLNSGGNGFINTQARRGNVSRVWMPYPCSSCGLIVIAYANEANGAIVDYFPKGKTVNLAVPEKPARFLRDAIKTMETPSASILMSAACVDATLKERGYVDGNLHPRIKKAYEDNLITDEMKAWAMDIKEFANDQRHADIDAEEPTLDDAKRCVEFAEMLAEILFVLPSRIAHHRNPDKPSNETNTA